MGEAESAAPGSYFPPPSLSNETGRSAAGPLCRFRSPERSGCLLREYGMGRQNRRAMRQRVCRRVVSATIHAKLADRLRTLVWQIDGVVADAARRLKILVSVVRFRPGPPRIQKTPPSGGVFVSDSGKILGSGPSPVVLHSTAGKPSTELSKRPPPPCA
jgi:hypothetical protein